MIVLVVLSALVAVAGIVLQIFHLNKARPYLWTEDPTDQFDFHMDRCDLGFTLTLAGGVAFVFLALAWVIWP